MVSLSDMEILSRPSPNFDGRGNQPLDMLVLHYTDMKTTEEAVQRLCDAEAKVSAHYVVGENGEIYQLVNETDRAWHAGESHWRGSAQINARSIGIEIANRGHSHDYPDFPDAQIVAVIALCKDIIERYNIPERNVVGHSDIAFLRKMDPGEKFPWAKLARAGVGVFPSFKPLSGSELQRDDTGNAVIRLQTSLSNWGYGLKLDGLFGEKTESCVRAFQRHYRPEKIDGVWDNECAGMLAALHASA